MGRPSKPYLVVQSENKAHRSKAEMKVREEGEKALLTGERMEEATEVEINPIAHEKFQRVTAILDKIEKTDALYETVVNRYCLMCAETVEIVEQRKTLIELLNCIRTEFENLKATGDIGTVEVQRITTNIMNTVSTINKLDESLAKKRKMLLDIEKENIMTIAGALRCVPKTPTDAKTTGPSLKDILGG